MIKAIVYMSETGHTKKYAELLRERISLPVYELNFAAKELPRGTEIIYLGWLMAGTVKGYKKAVKNFTVRALGAVGMFSEGSQLNDIKKTNHISDELPLFYLRGGFESDKLHGVYKLVMQTMKKAVGKDLAEKQSRTTVEEDTLALLLHGDNRVSAEQLSDILAWVRQNI